MSNFAKFLTALLIVLLFTVIGLNIYLNRILEPEVRQCVSSTELTREECEINPETSSEVDATVDNQ